MQVKDLCVLMISMEPGLAGRDVGTGGVIERHIQYANKVKALHIVVMGGSYKGVKKLSSNLTIYSTGPKRLTSPLRALKMSQEVITNNTIDCIVCQDPHFAGWVGYKLKIQFKKPLGLHFHGDFWNNKHWAHESLKNRFKNIIQRKIIYGADRLRVVSAGIADALIKSNISPDRIDIINTPINPIYFKDINLDNTELAQKYKYKKVVIFFGRLVAAKNLPFVLKVVNEARKAETHLQLLIIGQGVLQDSLRQMVKKLGLQDNVEFIGGLTPAELLIYLSISRVKLLLSTNESFGKVIIEAGLQGIPTLASKTTGAQTIITDNETGVLVPVNNLEESVSKLLLMMSDEDATQAMGKKARRKYQNLYASDTAIDQVISFWLKLAQA